LKSSAATLLLEIGCEEIPARMIAAASRELERRVVEILDDAGLGHGAAVSWSSSRRLATRVEAVEACQEDRDGQVLGPPAKIAFDSDGKPTPAAVGFARKQGIDPERLARLETERGSYVGFERRQKGKTVGEILADQLPARVGSMPFPKSMRWADGKHRWVRPVHWVLALHGKKTLDIELFGIASGNRSVGHRFRASGDVTIKSPDSYIPALERAGVVVEPAKRRARVAELLAAAATRARGALVEDSRLLDEVANLVEWPGVVLGGFDEGFLELPAEVLATTLRHHQKCFSLVDGDGDALPAFLAVANTDEDPGGHIQRGNEWVVGGRLEDAAFFWREDRRQPLANLSSGLRGVTFHAKVGSFAEKTARMEALARQLGKTVGLDAEAIEHAASAALLCKNDLLTGTVGEFPELQGQVGGLMLRAENRPQAVAQAVYEHYRPAGANDALPETVAGRIVAVVDKLDSIASLIGAGETPTGSRDPLGLRRASSGVFRVVAGAGWDLSINALAGLCAGGERLADFLADRLRHYLRETGATENEIRSVQRTETDPAGWRDWPLGDLAARLEAIARVRDRGDFEQLADLTKRVDNILTKGQQDFADAEARGQAAAFTETAPAAQRLTRRMASDAAIVASLLEQRSYDALVDLLAGYVDPVEQFFVDVLVVDKDDPAATLARRDLVRSLHALLTGCFDLRELAGQATRKGS